MRVRIDSCVIYMLYFVLSRGYDKVLCLVERILLLILVFLYWLENGGVVLYHDVVGDSLMRDAEKEQARFVIDWKKDFAKERAQFVTDLKKGRQRIL